jgi:protein TonB
MAFRTLTVVVFALASASPAWSQAAGTAFQDSQGNTVPPTGTLPSPAKPLDIRTWAGTIQHAYPAGLAGKVFLAVTVTPEGRATDCEIRTSSGHPVLDEAACNGMLEHARFLAARDASGAAVASRYSLYITYVAN